MLSPQVCPRCHSPIKAGRLACARCGLALDPSARVPSKVAPITTPLVASEAPASQQAAANRAIGGLLSLVLALALVVAAGVMQMNSSADGSPTPLPTRLTATRTTVVGIGPATPAPAASPTLVSSMPSPQVITPTASLPPLATATSIAIPATPTSRATDTPRPLPSSTPVPVRTATPRPPTTTPSLPAATATSAAIPATPTRRATDTPRPLPSPTSPPALPPTAPPPPPPTPRPVPGIGGTANDWNGWTIGLATMASRQQINAPSGVTYAPSGTFWLVWIDARNDGTATRSVGDTVDFLLQDDRGNLYTELSDHGRGRDTREIARIFGRDYLNASVAPGGITRTLLVFDIPSGASPAELVGRRIIDGRSSLPDPLRFDLTKK